MNASVASGGGAGRPTGRADFDAGRLFLADARLALLALNYGRHRALHLVFGTSREQANLLTFVLALGAADLAYVAARRAVLAPLGISGADIALAGFGLRETALGISGPQARAMPGVGALLTIGAVGGLAIPGLRRAAKNLRAAERRLREERTRRYSDALSALPGVGQIRTSKVTAV
jgi:hypothetical protein